MIRIRSLPIHEIDLPKELLLVLNSNFCNTTITTVTLSTCPNWWWYTAEEPLFQERERPQRFVFLRGGKVRTARRRVLLLYDDDG